MKSLWNDSEAAACKGDLGQRVYASRLLGRDPSLVLHGGGNTSVKIRERNVLGEEEDILYVKGSGQDLAVIEEAGFAPVRLERLRKLIRLESLPDAELIDELKSHTVRAGAPAPSVETFLHALVPHRFVDHTHADALLAVSSAEGGADRIREIYGDRVVVVPYAKPGFALAKAFFERFEKESAEATVGAVLMHHGIFSFGNSAKESYENMIELVNLAEQYLREKGGWEIPPGGAPEGSASNPPLAALRKDISDAAGFSLLLSRKESPRGDSFARRGDVAEISQRGPATPDHVLRTKRLPMVGLDAAAYAKEYERYFSECAASGKEAPEMVDPAPRIVLDAGLGLCAAGRSAEEADRAAEIYEHTIEIILRAEALGGYQALPAQEIFEVEYWALERARLSAVEGVFSGEVALVTGAASGIGRACVDSLHERGAAVVGLDLSPFEEPLSGRPDFLGLACDVTDPAAVAGSLERAVSRFGGLDMLILNAGIFPASRDIAELTSEEWSRVMRVNTDANLILLRECYPLLKLSPRGGRAVAVGSKNVPAPGRGAAAYSASKAALTQLIRVAALEWAADGIRINMIHPDAVFDTGVWTDEVLASRARSYGLSVEAYKKRNLLKAEVTSRDVAEMAAEMCGPLFAKTTGAQVPIDGGSDRVI